MSKNNHHSPSAKILVVDDDDGVRRFVGAVLRKNNYHVAFAADGLTALELALTELPNLVILDLTLPMLSGLAVCRELRKWYYGPILVLSAAVQEGRIVEALDEGADDYLTKPFRLNEMLARIRALLRRSGRGGGEQNLRIEAGGLQIDFARRRLFRDGQEIRLTRTEFDIISFLARHANRVVTSEMILQQVWGPHHGEYAQTLRVHIGHIRKKIEADSSRPAYILTEPGVGYRFAVDSAKSSEASA